MQLAEPAEVDQTLIKEGDTVIIRLHDDENNTFMLTASGTQKIGKSRISVKNIIGRPYGSLFLMNDRQLEHVDENELQNNSDDFNIIHSEEANSSKGDNSYYMDTNTAQKLKDEDIQNLKQSGCSGKDIIKSLIANSETW
jgi:tRNA (adenine-N(1)-)-methyltransferase non-catalytic subunit